MRNGGWVRCPDCKAVVAIPGEDQISTPLFAATCPRCGREFDWRLSYGHDFLRGATFVWQEYLALSDVWDHEHCKYCWQKFMDMALPGVERAGYVTYTPVAEWWVCRRCFEELGEELGLQVEWPDEPPA